MKHCLSCLRLRIKILVIAYKAIHSVAPVYIRDLVTIKPRSNYSLRSNNELLLVPPGRTKKTLGDRAFCAAAPKLWNNLPNNIRNKGGKFLKKLWCCVGGSITR